MTKNIYLLSLCYRVILGVCAIAGVALQIATDGLGMLMYYTVLSNLMVTVFVLILLWSQLRNKENNFSAAFYRVKGGVTMAILITFVIYHFLLSPFATPEQYWNIRNFLVHYIVPIGFVLDTFIFDLRKQYRRIDPLLWTAVPLAYSIWAIFNGYVTKIPVPNSEDSPFPYFFVNAAKYGWASVLKYAGVILVSYILVGYLLVLVKQVVGPKQELRAD